MGGVRPCRPKWLAGHDISCVPIKTFRVFQSGHLVCSNQDISYVPIKTSPSDPSPKLGGVQSAIIFTVSILGTNLAVALIATLVCWMKKRKRRAAVAQVQLDVNPMYGTVYYHLDR